MLSVEILEPDLLARVDVFVGENSNRTAFVGAFDWGELSHGVVEI